jgi:hypothetical protein
MQITQCACKCATAKKHLFGLANISLQKGLVFKNKKPVSFETGFVII